MKLLYLYPSSYCNTTNVHILRFIENELQRNDKELNRITTKQSNQFSLTPVAVPISSFANYTIQNFNGPKKTLG